MTGPPLNQDDIFARARQLRAAGVPLHEIDTYLQSKLGQPRVAAESLKLDVRPPAESTHGQHYDPNRPGDGAMMMARARQLPGWIAEGAKPTAALALSAAQVVPGVKAFEAAAGAAGSRLTGHPLSYRESHDALTAETEKIAPEVRMAAQIAAGGVAAPLTAAMTPAKAGMAIGAADALLDADPDKDLAERAGRGAFQGALGGAASKVLDAGIAGLRVARAKPVGANVLTREERLAAADDIGYGRAAAEGSAAGGTSPAIKAALKHPKIAPYAKMVRGMEQMQGASDAKILTEAYKLMSREQRRIGGKIASADDYLANDELRRDELALLKKKMAAAADPTMPSFRSANQQHAKAAGEMDAVETGAEAMSRAGTRIKPSMAHRLGPAAFKKKWTQMSPEEKKAAIEGILGQTRDQIRFSPNALSGLGSLTAADKLRRATPMIRDLGGTELQDQFARMALMSAFGLVP